MKHIVLITRRSNEQVSHISLYICTELAGAVKLCNFINSLALNGDNKLFARVIRMNKEYSMGSFRPWLSTMC